MRSIAGTRRISLVRASQTAVRLVLDVEPDSEPISGFLEADGEAGHQFWGWLELLAAIEAARSEGASATSTNAKRKESQ
jgi:hypothetical protein